MDDDGFIDRVLTRAEERHDLERKRVLGASVEVDLEDRSSPLHVYVAHRRKDAEEALAGLMTVNPNENHEVANLQAAVRHYLDVRDWARGVIVEAQRADAALQEGYHVED